MAPLPFLVPKASLSCTSRASLRASSMPTCVLEDAGDVKMIDARRARTSRVVRPCPPRARRPRLCSLSLQQLILPVVHADQRCQPLLAAAVCASARLPRRFLALTPPPRPQDIDTAARDNDQWILGFINGAPYLCSGLFGCWLSAPLNRMYVLEPVPRLGALSGLACTSIGQGLTPRLSPAGSDVVAQSL